jgi:hypothetical protein
MKRVVILVCALSVAGLVGADTMIEKVQRTDEFQMMGKTQPAKEESTTTWIGGDKLRNDQGSVSVIIRMDEKKMYVVNHDNESYMEIDLPIDMAKLMGDNKQMQQMMQMMQMDATVTETGDTKKVGPYDCRKYEMKLSSQMMDMEQELWLTKDVDFDVAAYQAMASQMMKLQPGFAEMAKEMEKLDGVAVLTESRMKMMGSEMTMSEKLVNVEEKAAPAGTYMPPAGYTAKPFDMMTMMQQGQGR